MSDWPTMGALVGWPNQHNLLITHSVIGPTHLMLQQAWLAGQARAGAGELAFLGT